MWPDMFKAFPNNTWMDVIYQTLNVAKSIEQGLISLKGLVSSPEHV